MIVEVAVQRPLWTLFDYQVPPELQAPAPGTRVRVPFGATEVVGIAVASKDRSESDSPLKSVTAILDHSPILHDVLELLAWAAAYYHHPPGDALFRRSRRAA
jgi:primosomal protein N' (replication factor Y)